MKVLSLSEMMTDALMDMELALERYPTDEKLNDRFISLRMLCKYAMLDNESMQRDIDTLLEQL